jgi:hypothetical protein
MGFTALGLPRHAIPRAQDQENSEVLAYQKLNNNSVFYALQGVIKMVRTGCRGSPLPRISAMPLCQATKCDLKRP